MPFGDNVILKSQSKKRYFFSKIFGWPPHIGNRVRARNARKQLSANPGEYILEIGSSYGVFSFDLAKKGSRVVGFDLDKASVLSSNRLDFPERNGHRPFFMVADAEAIPLRSAFFDKAVCIDVLEHVADDEAAVNEIFRVLKLGGSFVIHVPLDARFHISPLRLSKARARKREIGDMHERDGYIKEDILAVLSKSGFEIEQVLVTNRFFTAIAWELDNHFRTRGFLFPILYLITMLDCLAPARGNGFLIKAVKLNRVKPRPT